MSSKKEKRNAFFGALFLFQYSLLIPLMEFFRASLLVAGFGVIILFIMILVNRSVAINLKSLFVVAILSLFMILKHFVDGTEFNVLLNFFLIAIPPIIAFSFPIDWAEMKKNCLLLSNVNFLLLVLLPFSPIKVSYMRFGYGMLLTAMFSTVALAENNGEKFGKRFIKIIVFLASIAEMAVFGARGSILCYAIFFLIYLLAIKRTGKGTLILATLGTLIALNLKLIVSLVDKILQSFGVFSYSFMKITKMLEQGVEATSSGRDLLYRQAIENIRANPVLGIVMKTSDSGDLYVHNLFLQVGVDMGVIAMIIIFVFFVYSVVMLFRKSIAAEKRLILLALFCVSCGRLLISSTLWERPEFWALMCVMFEGISFKDRAILSRESKKKGGTTVVQE